MGTMYATYNAVTEIVNTAVIAVEPSNASSPTSSANAQSNQTVLTGVPVYVFILYSRLEKGRALSLANANDWREATRTIEVPIMYLNAILGRWERGVWVAYWTRMTNDHRTSVHDCPNELKNI